MLIFSKSQLLVWLISLYWLPTSSFIDFCSNNYYFFFSCLFGFNFLLSNFPKVDDLFRPSFLIHAFSAISFLLSTAFAASHTFFKINFYWRIVDLKSCVSFCCTAKWIIYTYTYILSFLDSFPIEVITEYWVEFPVLYSRLLLVTYFIYSSASHKFW